MRKLNFLLASAVVIVLFGCVSKGSFTPDGIPVTNVMESLINGEIRLTCDTACSGLSGGKRKVKKAYHDNEQWYDLALTVSISVIEMICHIIIWGGLLKD